MAGLLRASASSEQFRRYQIILSQTIRERLAREVTMENPLPLVAV